MAGDRAPQPDPGAYTFYISGCNYSVPRAGHDEYAQVQLLILQLTEEAAKQGLKEGDTVAALFPTTGKGAEMGAKKMKNLAGSALNCPTDEEYAEIDPDGWMLGACLGDTRNNPYAAKHPGFPLQGIIVRAVVRRGKDRPDGKDYYREFAWSYVPEEEQKKLLKEFELEE